jgi:hypothetical protein
MNERIPVQNLQPATEAAPVPPPQRSLTERTGSSMPMLAVLTVAAALLGGVWKILSD